MMQGEDKKKRKQSLNSRGVSEEYCLRVSMLSQILAFSRAVLSPFGDFTDFTDLVYCLS